MKRGFTLGLAVFIDNQIHEREYAGPEAGKIIASLIPLAENNGQLQFVYPHGDTMFHVGQIRQLIQELERIKIKNPEYAQGVNHLIDLLKRAIRLRGYIWIEGD
jgi:hypothetical protein